MRNPKDTIASLIEVARKMAEQGNRLGRYRDVMSENEAADIEKACADIMDVLGYTPTSERTVA